MKTNITRRQALKAAVAGALAPILIDLRLPIESELVDVEAFMPEPYGDPADWSPTAAARVLAAWELDARQTNRPEKWRRLKYDNALQWHDGRDGRDPLIGWFGIGPAEWTAERTGHLVDWLRRDGDGIVLAAERIACGRAFAIVSIGTLSTRLRYELRKPAWKRDRKVIV